MRDVFYTILVVWILWRIFHAVSAHNRHTVHSDGEAGHNRPDDGKTKVDYVPPLNKKIKDGEGEYVDYEEIK